MDFVKKMKKREFIEMAMKTLIGILVSFIVIILMEGMIYGIELHALKTKGATAMSNSDSTIAYCIEQSEDKYFVVYYNEAQNGEDTTEWSAVAGENNYKTKDECSKLAVKEVVWHAPNAFKFSITTPHYVVMAVFVVAVAGFFVYRFIVLNNSYKKIEEEYKKTGKIDI